MAAAQAPERARPPGPPATLTPLEPVGSLELEAARPPPRARPPAVTLGPNSARGVTELQEVGVGVIGFEGIRLEAPQVEDVIATIPRVRGISATGVGLEPVLEQGGRAPNAGLSALLNIHGNPHRIEALGRELSASVDANLERTRAELDVPSVHEVSKEALRMLDAYINRTDELHPLSNELLARAFTGASERMPPPGASVPVVDGELDDRVSASASNALLARIRDAAEHVVAHQTAFSETRQATAERVSLVFGLGQVRGTLIDQRS